MSGEIRRDGRLIAIEADEPGEGDHIAEGTLNGLTPVEWDAGDERMVPVPPVMDCRNCDASNEQGIARARAAGWTDVSFDPEGAAWSYIGLCPACTAKENAE